MKAIFGAIIVAAIISVVAALELRRLFHQELNALMLLVVFARLAGMMLGIYLIHNISLRMLNTKKQIVGPVLSKIVLIPSVVLAVPKQILWGHTR